MAGLGRWGWEWGLGRDRTLPGHQGGCARWEATEQSVMVGERASWRKRWSGPGMQAGRRQPSEGAPGAFVRRRLAASPRLLPLNRQAGVRNGRSPRNGGSRSGHRQVKRELAPALGTLSPPPLGLTALWAAPLFSPSSLTHTWPFLSGTPERGTPMRGWPMTKANGWPTWSHGAPSPKTSQHPAPLHFPLMYSHFLCYFFSL